MPDAFLNSLKSDGGQIVDNILSDFFSWSGLQLSWDASISGSGMGSFLVVE